ncbi:MULTISPECIES: hypothetical protein [Streptomyces]|uniref:hypothetical protein n=1 Tax=Streptomyces TaxID=1883 RepID=UPI00225C1854|nr:MULTISPECIES: hypothetical protein [Streptomyces]MCX5252528.1 hypothetical protein [Streptomyces sp. NBC_00201]
MAARHSAAAVESGEVAGGDRAGAGMLGRVEVAHPLGDVVAESVRQEAVGVAEVPVGLPLVAEGRVHPAGLRGDQRSRRGQGGLLRGDAEETEGVLRVAEVDHLVRHAGDDLHPAVAPPRFPGRVRAVTPEALGDGVPAAVVADPPRERRQVGGRREHPAAQGRRDTVLDAAGDLGERDTVYDCAVPSPTPCSTNPPSRSAPTVWAEPAGGGSYGP